LNHYYTILHRFINRSRSADGISLLAWLLYLGQFVFWALPDAMAGPAGARAGLLDVRTVVGVTISCALVVLLLAGRRARRASAAHA
jgi:hypothetical protein